MTIVVFCVTMVAFIVLILGILIPCLNINNENTILAIAGILATFVVVNNYAQVIEVRNHVNSKLDEIEKIRKTNVLVAIYLDDLIKFRFCEILKGLDVYTVIIEEYFPLGNGEYDIKFRFGNKEKFNYYRVNVLNMNRTPIDEMGYIKDKEDRFV